MERKEFVPIEYNIYVVGMRRELFVDEGPGDDEFDMVPISNCRDILFCTAVGTKFTITLYEVYCWCGSGWTTASWGQMEIDSVCNFGTATHIPKDGKIKIEGAKYIDNPYLDLKDRIKFETEYDSVETNVFSYNADGGDYYYPSGFALVDLSLFNKLPRAFDERPVWIFSGSSGTGKSTIAHSLGVEGKTVFETDAFKSIKELPDEIWADVIVVGNKNKDITVDEVKKRLPEDVKTVYVNFTF